MPWAAYLAMAMAITSAFGKAEAGSVHTMPSANPAAYSEDLPRKEVLRLAKADLGRVQALLMAHPDSLGALHDKLRLLHALSLEDKALVDSGNALLRDLQVRVLALAEPLPGEPISQSREALASSPLFSAPLRQAYGGALAVVLAKHALWPGTKMEHLDRGLPALDSAVAARPHDAEIRYLRLVSCYYLPFFLGRKASVREDFTALARLLPDFAELCPPRWYLGISDFVLKKGALTPPQMERLNEARQAVLTRLRGNPHVSGNPGDSG